MRYGRNPLRRQTQNSACYAGNTCLPAFTAWGKCVCNHRAAGTSITSCNNTFSSAGATAQAVLQCSLQTCSSQRLPERL